MIYFMGFCRLDKVEASVLDDPLLVSIGKKHGKSSAQVILRWLFQRNVVPIPKSVTPSRIQENLKVRIFSFIFLRFLTRTLMKPELVVCLVRIQFS